MLTIKKIIGLQGHFKNAPLSLYMTIQIKLLNIQLANLRPLRNIENIEKQYDEIHQINMVEDK